ncbi:FMN-linked oxidoreductase [Coniophora puteana RWD-64-598 SS2]|uniref:FMN-linked oxidoreductase n=1 Tax=Coniophora puteana (strain RWD-64-598) TaxID=741705 RepID=A0A5M3MX67_CONPW|nr:FMN-linked oxidoreductase [Coniophora puteana RWD-64-598 SS2]EIW83221.1 FMN-linked oxidoreductase [Coniophora puteana RWD-64-598 SS2]
MYEHLASFSGGPPNDYHLGLYSTWADSSSPWGMVMTGNVQVARGHQTLGRDMLVPVQLTDDAVAPYARLARAIHGLDSGISSTDANPDGTGNGTLAIMQLSHAGRQSPNIIGGRGFFESPLSASSIRVGTSKRRRQSGHASYLLNDLIANFSYWLLFQKPREMSIADIDELVQQFINGAILATRSGFDGVQIHAAHGYLLSQFLSSKTNKRHDAYSASPETVLNLLQRLVTGIRAVTPKNFILGIKINSADYMDSDDAGTQGHSQKEVEAEQEKRALDHVRALASWGTLDFIEISGGDYENPDFMESSLPPTKSRRQAFFSSFSRLAVQTIASLPTPQQQRPLILLTGGLRTPAALSSALTAGHADLLGIGRGAILCPHLPALLASGAAAAAEPDLPLGRDPDLRTGASPLENAVSALTANVKLIGAGFDMAWYVVNIRRMALAGMRGSRTNGTSESDDEHGAGRGQIPDYELSRMGALLDMWCWTAPGDDWAWKFWATGLGCAVLLLAFAMVSYAR